MARLHVVALGGKLRGWAAEAREDYLRRMPRGYQVALAARPPRGARIVALDERGREFTTRQFAAQLERWLSEPGPLAFLIGGADGLDEKTRREAALVMRLSALTLPHALAEVVLVEQLYRAATLLTGHPYHRD
jgi:23S rRNA (pseudouridine1915-N3)-methyltransferase